jgi:F-box/TPR repeat protein Pof3
MPNLEELRLHWDPDRSDRFASLTYPLDLTKLGFPKLRRLDLRGLNLPDRMNLPAGLEYIRFQGCSTLIPSSREEFRMELPNLSTLIFVDSGWANSASITRLLEAVKNPLKVFRVEQIGHQLWGEHIMGFVNDTTALQGLNELSLAYIHGVYDHTIRHILENIPDLQILHLQSTNITGCLIRAITDKKIGSKIKQIYVDGCDDVSSDAVVYGWERGIEVFKKGIRMESTKIHRPLA